jgi:hypothetical protein
MNLKNSHPALFKAAMAAVALVSLAGQLIAQQPRGTADELVRRMVQKELRATGEARPAWLYRLRRETPRGSQIKEMVETREGIVARLVAINDRPLTPQERADDDKRIAHLMSTPSEQQKKAKQQREEAARVSTMIGALPQAFLYQFDGTEPGRYGEMIRLKFKPNPDFDPPSRETLPFKSMSGTMWIDASDERLTRIDATLLDDVTLGWGLVARLHKGGRFEVEQSKVADGEWMITRMRLDFDGKALLFKTISIKQMQTLGDFRKAPKGLTLSEGVNLLRKQPEVLAEKR